jgi:hypothetical protein
MKMKIIKEFKKKDEISMAAENIKVLNEEEPPTKTTSWIRYFFTNSKEDCKFNCKLCKKKISSTSIVIYILMFDYFIEKIMKK